ncbi:eukaryotic translation initiation factor 2D isoform X4 [Fukomys damarensis]|uniref:eukaryotic translation initiation factor 2D isoform X4 n=1 Tax=Fukomys damarensis TaxID=885580 RepID=UPI001455BC09|nr:eukaryotic translation initiation factor 2D isoform X4 [Fukomys damarensis]
MFSKAFRVKSNTAIKGSDRRKLRADVTAAFATLGTDQVSELIPGKEELNIVKLYTHKGDAVTAYTSAGNPILFELEKNLYPTDLMLPGLVVPPAGLPRVQKGELCAIALVGNRAPVAIGVAAMSTAEMLAAGLKGRGFSVLHTYQDHLWQSGDKSSPPSIAPPLPDATDVSEEKVQGDMRGLALRGEEGNGEACRAHGESSLPEAPEDGSGSRGDPSQDLAEGKSLPEPAKRSGMELQEAARALQQGGFRSVPAEQMDGLLRQCFLHALKCRVRKADLPLLTSTLLGSHMFSCCPEGQQLDIKKSSYKKRLCARGVRGPCPAPPQLSKFLQHMQQEEIVQVKELSRGVESVVAVDWKHPSITSFVIPEPSPASQTVQEGGREQPYRAPDVKALYCVPASMTLLFRESGHRKGSALEASEVRATVIDYVKKNDLVDADNKNLVKLDPVLCDCILEKNEQHTVLKLPWDNLLSRCLEKLQPAYQVTFPGQEPLVKKGKICPIDISLAQRTYNKKVTVVRNLEAYGLDPSSVASALQQRCHASTTVTPVPGAKDGLQVQIQGNQIHHLGRLLLEEFGLPRKHIQGLEKAPRPGKK